MWIRNTQDLLRADIVEVTFGLKKHLFVENVYKFGIYFGTDNVDTSNTRQPFSWHSFEKLLAAKNPFNWWMLWNVALSLKLEFMVLCSSPMILKQSCWSESSRMLFAWCWFRIRCLQHFHRPVTCSTMENQVAKSDSSFLCWCPGQFATWSLTIQIPIPAQALTQICEDLSLAGGSSKVRSGMVHLRHLRLRVTVGNPKQASSRWRKSTTCQLSQQQHPFS